MSRTQVLASGMTRDALKHRIRVDGPWQRLIPGVYLTVTGTPTVRQREIAALLYGGPRSVITGGWRLCATTGYQCPNPGSSRS